MRRPTLTVLGALAATIALLTGCGSPSGGASPAGATGSGSVTGGITVLAAASLTESFTTLSRQFETTHPGTTITLSFGSSSSLAAQVLQGAPADVFASASQANMDQVVTTGAADGSTAFARNAVEIAVPPGNPARIGSVADLGRPGVRVALCAPEAPCGAVARTVLANTGVTVTPATNEATVKATLTKVELGEVDAGLVFVTDVRAAGAKVTGIPVPVDVNASTAYPIATLATTRNAPVARAFVDHVLSDDGRAVLASAGFGKP